MILQKLQILTSLDNGMRYIQSEKVNKGVKQSKTLFFA